MKTATLQLKRRNNLLSIKPECPQCGNKYIHGVPYVQIPCKKCGSSYKTDFKQSMYTKVAARLQTTLAWNDKVILQADEEFYQDLTEIEKNYLKMKNWDVKEITKKKDTFKYCNECGICYECYTCKECNDYFKPKRNLRKQKCIHCGSNEFTKTYFKDSENKKCPNCQSTNVKFTLTKTKSKCEKCESKDLSKTITKNIYTLTIQRKKSYQLDQ